jgi:pimeloyl-ACP methyl ester carboxylesterase
MHRKTRYLLPALLLMLAGCSGLLLRPGADASVAAALPAGVSVAPGALRSASGCSIRYRLFSPADDGGHDTAGDDLVVLAHGFLRSQDQMRDLAVALARSGVRVATLDFCNASPWDGGHVQNALDMKSLARRLGARRVVYAGFSAGGLAAVIAARNDPAAIGVVTLDLVETQGLGVRAAKGLGKPLLGLTGEPTNCNALDNGRAVLAAADQARVQHIEGAGHCDFEAPSNRLCEMLCQDPDRDPGKRAANDQPLPGPAQRQEIIASATLAVRSLLDGDPLAWPGDRRHWAQTAAGQG